MSTSLQDQAIDYAEKLIIAHGRALLCAKDPATDDSPMLARFCTSRNQAAAFIVTNWASNLYSALCPPEAPFPNKKHAAKDVTEARFCWVECDINNDVPPADLPAIKEEIIAHAVKLGLTARCAIDSGWGIWLLYQIEQTRDIAGVQAANKALIDRMNAFGGDRRWKADDCHNPDRIGRLPYTWNRPTPKKLAAGRSPDPVQATVISDTPVPLLTLEDFKFKLPTSSNGNGTAPSIDYLSDVDALDEYGVPDWTQVLIVQGVNPDDLDKYPSRSEALWAVVCELTRCKVPESKFLGTIMNKRFGIAASVLDKKDPERYARRQIEQAHEAVDQSFRVDAYGKPINNQHNIRVALRRLGCSLVHDTFADRLLCNGEHLGDKEMARLYLEVERRFVFRPGKDYFWMTVEQAARDNPTHPVCEFLARSTWDRKRRTNTWLSRYLGAPCNAYTVAVGAIVLIAAVRRVRQPGCKFDELLILEGPQGTAKSSALAALAVRDEWFSDSLPLDADGKRAIEALAGRWIVETPELVGMRKGDVENLKSFLSRRVDRARLAYGRLVTEAPRQCILVGTTNSHLYLKDGSGGRRFWPVKTGKIDLKALKRDVLQLWAEAAEREAQGASIRLDPKLWPLAGIEQEQRRVEDPWLDQFRAVLGDLQGRLRASDAWHIVGLPTGQRNQAHKQRLGEALRELGWERTKARFGGKPEWCYVRGDARTAIEVVGEGEDAHVAKSY